MRALLLHADTFATNVIEESNWPQGIQPEIRKSNTEKMEQCLVCFFTVEQGDALEQLANFYSEIVKTAVEIGTKNLMISPFAHLSNKLATPALAKNLYEELVRRFAQTDYQVRSSHFGYHKTLLLQVKGHPGSFRYREF